MNYQKSQKKIQKNIFEFKYTTNQRKNNRYKNYFNNNKEDFNFKSFEQININEKRFQELKDKYFLFIFCYSINLYSSLTFHNFNLFLDMVLIDKKNL